MCNIKELRGKIEETRQRMYKAYGSDPNDPHVLFNSQSLDVLLNKYNQALKKAMEPNLIEELRYVWKFL